MQQDVSPDQVWVTVRLGEPLWRTTGQRRLRLRVQRGSTVADVVRLLATQYPALASQLPSRHQGDSLYALFLDSVHVPWSQTTTEPVEEGATIYILPPAAGGALFHPLERSFYDRDTVRVAQDLLGCYLVREWEGTLLVGRIVETEAYVGLHDRASHASVGKTDRNAVMFGPPGHAYVYLIYGVHHCLNVVTEAPDFPAAVLIRALEPISGVDVMRRLRNNRPIRELTNGPGKLCQAMAIDRRLNGHDLCRGETLWIAPGEAVAEEAIARGPRVGVRGDQHALKVPWRFAIREHPFVSPPRL